MSGLIVGVVRACEYKPIGRRAKDGVQREAHRPDDRFVGGDGQPEVTGLCLGRPAVVTRRLRRWAAILRESPLRN